MPTDRKYLFVIDGAKALRAGIEEVFGAPNSRSSVAEITNFATCLATTNIIESPQGGVARRTDNVTSVASAWLLTEQQFRKIERHKDLWALATNLGRPSQASASKEQVA